MKTAALLIAVLFVAGCAKDGWTRWGQQRDSLTNAQNAASMAGEAGKLTAADVKVIDPAFKASRAALSDAESRLPPINDAAARKAWKGDDVFESDLKIVAGTAARVLATYANPPTTQPAK